MRARGRWLWGVVRRWLCAAVALSLLAGLVVAVPLRPRAAGASTSPVELRVDEIGWGSMVRPAISSDGSVSVYACGAGVTFALLDDPEDPEEPEHCEWQLRVFDHDSGVDEVLVDADDYEPTTYYHGALAMSADGDVVAYVPRWPDSCGEVDSPPDCESDLAVFDRGSSTIEPVDRDTSARRWATAAIRIRGPR